MAEFHVRVPPDGAGKRIKHSVDLQIPYENLTGVIEVGDTLLCSISQVTGKVTSVKAETASSGWVFIVPTTTALETTFGENIVVNSVIVAKVSATQVAIPLFIPTATLVGGNNPDNLQYIDDEGAAYTRFAEGSPQFDAFGKLRSSSETVLGEHIMQYNTHPHMFTDVTNGTASITHEPLHSGVLLSTGVDAGDKAERVSNRYHRYQAGTSQLLEITCACGDTGKTGVVRTWGYGDDDDGVFFRLNETQLEVVIRSSITGSMVERTIPQSEWNGDTLDGQGAPLNISGHSLDVSKDNIYWIDFQWLGAGRVRYGVFIDGVRIVCHEEFNSNRYSRPYMRTGSLPIYYDQENIGAAGSGSEFRIWCSVVKTEGVYRPPSNHNAGYVLGKTVDADNTAIISFRSKQTFYGVNNRINAYGSTARILSADAPVLIELVRDGTLGGSPSWAFDPGAESSVEADVDATTVTGGHVIDATIVPAGVLTELDMSKYFTYDGVSMQRHADVTKYDTYSFRASLIPNGGSPVTPTSVSMTVTWTEEH